MKAPDYDFPDDDAPLTPSQELANKAFRAGIRLDSPTAPTATPGTTGELLREALQECSTQLWHAIEAKAYAEFPLQRALKMAKDKADAALAALSTPPTTPGEPTDVEMLDWLESIIDKGRGSVEFGLTEDGNTGIWTGNDNSLANAVDLRTAVRSAMEANK